jgi:menaquinol-cytochrome c reductase iron-sulfur subunit
MCAATEGTHASENQGAEASAGNTSRRSFLGVLLAVGSSLVGALLAVPLLRFALFPLLRRTTEVQFSQLGSVSDFESLSEPEMRTIEIEQIDGWRKAVSQKAVYVTKDGAGKLLVLTSVCPHLGCTVPWKKERNQFVCPCHGGTFRTDGTRVSGPSLRGMDALETSVQDGQLSVRFQYFRQLIAGKEVIG